MSKWEVEYPGGLFCDRGKALARWRRIFKGIVQLSRKHKVRCKSVTLNIVRYKQQKPQTEGVMGALTRGNSSIWRGQKIRQAQLKADACRHREALSSTGGACQWKRGNSVCKTVLYWNNLDNWVSMQGASRIIWDLRWPSLVRPSLTKKGGKI